MKRVEKYAEEIISRMEQERDACWVDDIDESTMQRVITVCENVVRSWMFEKVRGR